MISLVLDQATHKVGYAVLLHGEPTPTPTHILMGKLIQHGTIETSYNQQLVDRLKVIQADLRELIRAYSPNEMVIEDTAFRHQRGRSANVLVAVESLCRDVAKEHGLPLYKQNPGTIKLIAAGHGKASKEEVMEAAMKWWGIQPGGIIDDNHSDALAASYTWLKKATEVRAKKAIKK